MTHIPYSVKPVLKVGETSVDQAAEAYISFGEWIDIPKLGTVDMRIYFEKNNSFEQVTALVEQLKEAGFTLVIEPQT